MKTYLQIALFAIFILGINGVDVCGDAKGNDIDEDFCRVYPTPENYTHCCYLKSDTLSECRALTDDQYENIKRYKKYMKQIQGYENLKIKCSGKFLTYSLFVLLALLF